MRARASLRSLAVLVVAVALAPAVPARATIGEGPCVLITQLSARGSVGQLGVHIGTFIPAFEDRCSRAQGAITYEATGTSDGTSAAIRKEKGDDSSPSTVYTADQPLTTLEKQIAEFDLMNPFRPALASTIHQIPVYVDGVALAYNVAACTSAQIKMPAATLALIYLGRVTSWDDPVLVAQNPSLAGCTLAIKPAVRVDEAGTTGALKEYLSKVNPVWTPFALKETADVWPSTLNPCRGIGESGMASCASDPGGIGYVQYKVARARGLTTARVENATGSFVKPASSAAKPNADNCIAAVTTASLPPTTTADWGNFSLTYGAAGYPLCHFSYAFAYGQLMRAYHRSLTPSEMATTYWYLDTVVSDAAQNALTSAGYVPLPENARDLAQSGVRGITE